MYKRQIESETVARDPHGTETFVPNAKLELNADCLLYTSDAADDLLCVDLGLAAPGHAVEQDRLRSPPRLLGGICDF